MTDDSFSSWLSEWLILIPDSDFPVERQRSVNARGASLSTTATLSRIFLRIFGNRIETRFFASGRSVATTQVERVVLNALAKDAALPPDICASGDSFPIGPSRTSIFTRSRSTFNTPAHANKLQPARWPLQLDGALWSSRLQLITNHFSLITSSLTDEDAESGAASVLEYPSVSV